MSSYAIPNVVEKRPTGERAVDIYSRLLSDRIVYLGTEIDDGVANVVVAQLLHLESEDSERPIDLYLNSPGGSMTAMLAIYDTMQFIHAPVSTTCVGQTASAAAVLLAAGIPGRRYVLPHSRVLLHQPSAQGQGSLPDLVLHAREIVRIRGSSKPCSAGTPDRASSGSGPIPTGTRSSPPRRRWRTGWRMRSSPAGSRPPEVIRRPTPLGRGADRPAPQRPGAF